jgi:hypothetical protein
MSRPSDLVPEGRKFEGPRDLLEECVACPANARAIVDRLMHLATGDKVPEAVSLRAIEELFDRLYGKPFTHGDPATPPSFTVVRSPIPAEIMAEDKP